MGAMARFGVHPDFTRDSLSRAVRACVTTPRSIAPNSDLSVSVLTLGGRSASLRALGDRCRRMDRYIGNSPGSRSDSGPSPVTFQDRHVHFTPAHRRAPSATGVLSTPRVIQIFTPAAPPAPALPSESPGSLSFSLTQHDASGSPAASPPSLSSHLLNVSAASRDGNPVAPSSSLLLSPPTAPEFPHGSPLFARIQGERACERVLV